MAHAIRHWRWTVQQELERVRVWREWEERGSQKGELMPYYLGWCLQEGLPWVGHTLGLSQHCLVKCGGNCPWLHFPGPQGLEVAD